MLSKTENRQPLSQIMIDKSCVMKIFVGNYYVILKAKSAFWAIHNFLEEVVVNKKVSEYDRFCKIFKLWDEKGGHITGEFILVSGNPYELLKAEQIALDNAKNDEYCLNTSFDAYIPMKTQINGKKSWINRGYYLNFCIWKKRRKFWQNI